MNRSLFVRTVVNIRICRVSFLIALCLTSSFERSLAADAPLTAAEAAKKVGEKVTVELLIQSAGRNGEFHELYSAKEWKADDCFILRFSGSARERFAEVNIADVCVHFFNETVRVTGEVKLLNFGEFTKPVVYVENIEQIEVVSTKREFTATEKYQKKALAGFTVLIHPGVFQDKQQGAEIVRFIEGQLKALNGSLPKDKLDLLHPVRIWIEHDGKFDGAAFHPSALWLKRNGHNPDKAGCIEVSNARGYVQWCRDQNVSGILHEMSHALHLLHMSDKNEAIKAAYDHAIEQKLYVAVAYLEGGRIREGKRQAYAMTNDKEYFAEISEAYFGHNDFFPFTRNQLKSHDSVGYDLIKEVWIKPAPKSAPLHERSGKQDSAKK